MRSFHAPRCGFCVLLGFCVALLTACTGVLGTSKVSSTPTPTVFVTPHGDFGVPPSVAAFCPSPQALASIVGEMTSPGTGTGTFATTTSCDYMGPSGDGGLFQIIAWYDAQSAKSDYTRGMNAAVQVGAPVQTVTGLGDAAYYVASNDGWLVVLKGAYDFTVKWYFLRTGADEHVNTQIARLLLTRI